MLFAMGLDSPPILLLAGLIGYLVRERVSTQSKQALGTFNILFFMPLVMGVTFAKRGFHIQDIWVTGSVLTYVLIITPLILRLTRGLGAKRRAGIIIASIFPNSVNLPLPILLALRGDYSYAAVYAILINLIQVAYIAALATMLNPGKRGTRATIGFFIKGMTPLYGAALGYYVFLNGGIPPALQGLLDFMRSLGIFMFVLAAGLSMPSLGLSTSVLRELKPVIYTRFLISPLLVLFYFSVTSAQGYGVDWEPFVQVLVESVMPPAVINVSYSAAFGFDTNYVAVSVVVLTLPGAVLGALLAYLL